MSYCGIIIFIYTIMDERIKEIVESYLGEGNNLLISELSAYMYAVMDRVMEDTELRCEVRHDIDDIIDDKK